MWMHDSLVTDRIIDCFPAIGFDYLLLVILITLMVVHCILRASRLLHVFAHIFSFFFSNFGTHHMWTCDVCLWRQLLNLEESCIDTSTISIYMRKLIESIQFSFTSATIQSQSFNWKTSPEWLICVNNAQLNFIVAFHCIYLSTY